MLQVEQLNQYYGASHTLRGVSLSVEKGQCLALLGRNGVGKTTLLKCLMGVLPVAQRQRDTGRSRHHPPDAAPARRAGHRATCRRAARFSPG